MIIAVYGTLKKGCSNHQLLSDCKYIGNGVTPPKYDLVDLNYFPGLVDGENIVEVELYEVDNKDLLILDRLEGVPTLYTREKEDIYINNIDNPIISAYIYKLNHSLYKHYPTIPVNNGVVSW